MEKLHLLSTRPIKSPTIFQVPVRQQGIEIITPHFIRTMHKRGAVIQVWTINDEEEMRRLYQMGVDSVMTDKPELAIKVAAELGIRTTQ